jgi:hypothetical protein
MIFVKQKMPVDTSLITFKTISNFTNDLGEVFSEKHRPLKLYAHLINKTTLSHEKPIEKHIEGFRNFCIANRDAISNRSVSKLAKEKIIYSKRVYINMKEIFQMADAETSEVIWMHLLTISALVDPAGKAREILKEVSSKGGGGQEINFLTDIISKVEANVKPNSNPMEAVSAIMQSGIFSELVSGMGNGLQDGSLDISKLVGTVQKMVTQLSADAGDQEGGEQAMNMINTMMSSISAGANSPSNDGTPQPMPDIASMLGPMMAMMGGGGGGGIPNLAGMLGGGGGIPNLSGIMEGLQNDDSIEEKIKKQVEAARSSGQLE